MSRILRLFAILCALSLAGASACFAQEPSTEQEAPQQSPQQPVYYAVPAQTQNVQYVVMPAAQAPQPQQTYMVTPQPVPVQVQVRKPKQSVLSFFMGLDLNFYASSLYFEEDNDYEYNSDYAAEHEYKGNGFNAGISMGILIKDFIGVRGLLNLGMQSGESSYWSSKIRCYGDSCSNIDTDVIDFEMGISGTLFPFNSTDNPMYNAYLEGAFGMALHEYDDDYALDFERDFSATMFIRLEVGKLFSIDNSWNVGFGVAYVLDIQYDNVQYSYEETYYSDIKHSIWAGVRFARKLNKF